MSAPAGHGPVVRRALLGALGGAVVLQLVVLYLPRDPGPLPFPQADKLVHLGVFLLPAALGLLAGLPARWVLGLLAGHAVLSEVVQALVLPARSGDPLDTIADLLGVALGALLARLPWVRRAGRRSGAPVSRW
ncbi:VanZ family protein [Phycicoccus avicenniae]|uniref:VanZ family protein n=1 Tax=Phycicoccus avicenniae TaxID=2828860 RepID=UPI003D2E2F8D